MIDGFVLGPGEGDRVSPAMTLKVGDKHSQAWSMFEVVDIGPGFDVGAHLHRHASVRHPGQPQPDPRHRLRRRREHRLHGDGPQVMATFRNLAISLLHLSGVTEITRTLQAIAHDRTGLLKFLPL